MKECERKEKTRQEKIKVTQKRRGRRVCERKRERKEKTKHDIKKSPRREEEKSLKEN